MLGISGTELVIILFFGFLIFGPEKLPQMGRTVGRAIRQFRQASDSMNKKFQDEVKDPFEEAVAPVRDAVNGAGAPIKEDLDAINENLNGIKSTITDPFKDALKFDTTTGGKQAPATPAGPRPNVVSGGTAATARPAAAKPAAAAAAATAASAGEPAGKAEKAAPAAASAASAASADSAFSDPFAGIASTAASGPKAGKPAGQPLPETGGTVKKSIAASLYDLDDAKDGE